MARTPCCWWRITSGAIWLRKPQPKAKSSLLGQLREQFEPVKARLARPLAQVPPLLVTFMGIPLSLAAAWMQLQGWWGISFALAFASGATDFLDGAVARLQKRTSLLGNYLEAVTDRVVELILLLALAIQAPLPAAFAIGTSMLVSYLKPRVALVVATDNRDWPGIGDHADRMVLILFAYLFRGLPGAWSDGTLWLLAVVSAVGAGQRLIYAVGLIARQTDTSARTPQSARETSPPSP